MRIFSSLSLKCSGKKRRRGLFLLEIKLPGKVRFPAGVAGAGAAGARPRDVSGPWIRLPRPGRGLLRAAAAPGLVCRRRTS